MTSDEIETALQKAFSRCNAAGYPLSEMQKQILLQAVKQIQSNSSSRVSDSSNPLDELTPEELEAFLEFVKAEEEQNRTWKVQLLNDWLLGNDSGNVQFIRESYGLQWLSRVEAYHFDKYSYFEEALKLKVGDRIEVSNGLWEWIPGNDLDQQEWFPCIVIRVYETENIEENFTNCVIRFLNGKEYEIQGIYEWNRYNWR